MVRIRTGKAKDPAFASGRLTVARAYLKEARKSVASAEEGDIFNPSIAAAINCAIAYSDALTARFRGEINQGDHLGLVKLLRATLGNEFPNRQEANLKTLLDQKDEVQYGARLKTREEAERTLARLEDFATWAESRLSG